jgi:hypothetical protein
MRNEVLIVRLPESGSRNYEAQLRSRFEELERAGKIEPAAIADAWICHEGFCAVRHGHPCNCNASLEISLRENEPEMPA